jgi:hypothetical protein
MLLSTAPVVCFLDESGTDDQQLDDAAVGGILINQRHLNEFDRAWNAMLRFHGVRNGLHLKEFGPGGKNAHLVGENRAMLFTAAVQIIDDFKIVTMGASLDNRRRKKAFSAALQARLLSSYGLAFMMCVAFHSKNAAHHGYEDRIDFVLDAGNPRSSHVRKIHEIVTADETMKMYQVGTLAFCDDETVPALQAADVIAWATRRRRSGKQFNSAYQPLLGLFNNTYIENALDDATLADLSARFAAIEATITG